MRLVIAPESVLSLEMLLKDKSSQVRLEMLVMMLCLLRVVSSLPSPATELILLLDNLMLVDPDP